MSKSLRERALRVRMREEALERKEAKLEALIARAEATRPPSPRQSTTINTVVVKRKDDIDLIDVGIGVVLGGLLF